MKKSIGNFQLSHLLKDPGKLIANDTPANIKRQGIGELFELTPSDFVSAKELVPSLEGVRELQTYADKLHVFVDNASRRKAEISAALAAQGIRHNEIRRIEPRTEEAFISLIRQQTQATACLIIY